MSFLGLAVTELLELLLKLHYHCNVLLRDQAVDWGLLGYVLVEVVQACSVYGWNKLSLYFFLYQSVDVNAFEELMAKDFVCVALLAQSLFAIFLKQTRDEILSNGTY